MTFFYIQNHLEILIELSSILIKYTSPLALVTSHK